ncbi:DUF389 domain-containing protein [Acaricomes phytoseiuli]|uniref:DUF389 domain-containing protein n=1 Tax=Acaricomes phytoseiuli TaxID=291968 RepID=UPI0003816C27|nr:DUF389 domain-containing protein [Acaricomes phytoseiuli]MCW1250105.1 DUF389 domain-containing protein [Acaricomes phytoseiuli]
MTLRLRVFSPEESTDAVLELIDSHTGTAELAVFRDVALESAGDLITALVARESVGDLIDKLARLGLTTEGSISVDAPELVLSQKAREAAAATPGADADAVIWDEVESTADDEARLSWSFLAFLVIATQLAGIGIVTNSTIVIVGAMVVGPEFGPLSGLALGLAERRWTLIRRAAVTLLVGFPVAMALCALAVWISLPLGLFDPASISQGDSAVEFIYHPGPYSFIVAMLAGAAGMLSLISRRSTVLVGVFISVTTVPAAGFVAVALVLGETEKAAGSAIQLLLNLLGIVVSAFAVLMFYRLVRRRKQPVIFSRNPYRAYRPRQR